MRDLTPEALRILEDIARRHEVSLDAAVTVLRALVQGNGSQAQFNHPDLGGMGQWSQGGMIMIGDMFNHDLKHRVDALCNDLAHLLRSQPSSETAAGASRSQGQTGDDGRVGLFVPGSLSSSGRWWPVELGDPASTGAQNDLRYAYFPGPRRLAIQHGGRISIHDCGEHRISGFSQQQSGDQSLTFTSQFGLVRVAELPLIVPRDDQARDPSPSVSVAPPQAPSASLPVAPDAAPAGAPPSDVPIARDDILSTIERLAELRQKNILTEQEFVEKKAALLSRL
jgi:hypothetical protein